MSELDELILASRALAHAASQVISLEQVPSRIVHEFYQAVLAQQEASKARPDSALDRASIPAMNITNAVPPICTKHHETMVLSFYDRPGSPPGNGYACRSCAKERQTAAQGLGIGYDPSKSRLQSAAPEPKMQRALAEGEFNVVGDELRKLNVIVCDLNAHIESIEQELVGSMRLLHSRIGAIEARLSDLKIIEPAVARIECQLSTFKDGTYERINLLATDNEKMQAQLTALRAEADKGRVEMPTEGIEGMLARAIALAEIGEIPTKSAIQRWRTGLFAQPKPRKKKQGRKRGRK